MLITNQTEYHAWNTQWNGVKRADEGESSRFGAFAVVNLLRFHEAETAICFCATRESVRRLHATLQNRGFGVVALSGEHSQSERNQALQALRDRRARVCVATDVAARGIDLPTLSLVIHVEIPRDAETLQHRSGRTGRAGEVGLAVSFIDPTTVDHFRLIEKRAGVQVPRERVAGFEPTTEPVPRARGRAPVKGRRKSKKDKLREKAGAAAAAGKEK